METKDRILKVTEKMFLKSGYKNLRTDDIAREALRLAAMKLPVKTRVVIREDW